MDGDKCITLTPSGYEIAERIYRRHRVLAQFLVRIGVSERPPFSTPAAWNTTSPRRRSPPFAAMRRRTGSKPILSNIIFIISHPPAKAVFLRRSSVKPIIHWRYLYCYRFFR
ncbi:MAG: iron dependent repressor, metal binding and dimerization domain protein [Eubacteriales bacterium]